MHLSQVCKFIADNVLKGGSVVRMMTLRELYLQHIQVNAPQFHNPDHKMQKLKEKIQRNFGDHVQFWRPNNKSELLYSSCVSTGEAVEAAFDAATSEDQLLRDAALVLHRHIIAEKNASPEMPWPPTADYLNSDVIGAPAIVSSFIARVITGSKLNTVTPSNRVDRVAKSISEDLSTAATGWRWTMPKHLLLGMAVRHLTGSVKVGTLLNRLGHCCSYSQLLDLENAMAIQTKCRDSFLPYNISVDYNKILHTCFDNFDLIEETPSGAGTTHTTHGIVIQEVTSDHIPTVVQSIIGKNKEKIKFVADCLPPFFCNKRVEPTNVPAEQAITSTAATFVVSPQEHAWIISRGTFNNTCSVPEWSGWLSLTADRPVTRQSVIGFMPPIMHPITEYQTVHHCLQLSCQAAEKVGQKYSVVTMDLAAAKIAYDIKWHKPNEFANTIINLGGFHMECSYMGAIGKMMKGSGMEDLIIESGICASGSINQVILGKHYNRAMHVHQIMLDATERLLMTSFLKQPDSPSLPSCCESLAGSISRSSMQDVLNNPEFQSFTEAYDSFREDVRQGKYGLTAKFWITYMNSVRLLFRFQQAIKCNDLDMYISTMYSMLGILFGADHLNYARYMP